MHLSLMRYEYGTTKKEFMAIVIGEHNNKIILIDDKFVDEDDANKIRQNLQNLSNFSVPNVIKWIRENCPKAYKGYKEIYESRITQLQYIDIKQP